MPYSRNADLPAQVRNPLPDAAQTLFRTVVNAQLNRGVVEERAFATAWTQVGRQYRKPSSGGKWVHKLNSTLYVHRKIENAADIIKWAKDQGFKMTMVGSELHATVMYSKVAVDWPTPDDDVITIRSPAGREVAELGDAVVLKFRNSTLNRRHEELCAEHGCVFDHDEYIPHLTITYEPGDLDISKVKPYEGDIVLGPEVFEAVNENYRDDMPAEKLAASVSLCKVDKKLGIVFGWAIISKKGGEDYYDLQGDHIPEDAMLEAATDFMLTSRTLKVMHKGEKRGTVVFAWPLTAEIAKAMGLRSGVTGLMIGVKPSSKSLLKDIEAGKFTGFSIGGFRIDDEEVE